MRILRLFNKIRSLFYNNPVTQMDLPTPDSFVDGWFGDCYRYVIDTKNSYYYAQYLNHNGKWKTAYKENYRYSSFYTAHKVYAAMCECYEKGYRRAEIADAVEGKENVLNAINNLCKQ